MEIENLFVDLYFRLSNLIQSCMKKLAVIFLAPFLFFSCVKTPEACVEVDNANPSLGQVITFTDCSENMVDFNLDFGDGKDVDLSDNEMTHYYESPGTFNVVLTAYSKDDKKSNEASVTVTVKEPTDAEIEGTWHQYKEEVRNTFLDPIAEDTYSADDYYGFAMGGVATINTIVTTYNLVPSTGEITIDGTLFSIVKFYQNEMVLKQEYDMFSYSLLYFEKQ